MINKKQINGDKKMTKYEKRELKVNEKWLYEKMQRIERRLVYCFGMEKYAEIQVHKDLCRARKNWSKAYDLLKKNNLKPYVKSC